MKYEFKVGDRVRIREWDDMEKEFGCSYDNINCFPKFVSGMKHLCGRKARIIGINRRKVCLQFDDTSGDTDWEYYTDMIEPLILKEKITIERYGNKVVAKWGKRTGVAKCNPEDSFDFFIGATLAFERLMQSENVTRKIIDDALNRIRDELYETHGIK